MKKSRSLLKMLLLVFAMMLLFDATKVSAKSSTIIAASVTYDKETNTLTVRKGNNIVATCPYKKETVYAKKTIKLVSLGPSPGYTKSNKIKKNVGDSVIRIGTIFNNKWSIVNRNGRYYFILNSNLTTKKASYLSTLKYSPSQLKHRGVIYWGGWRWTWYSQKVMPGRGLHIPGRHVVNGYVCDKYGYICLASGRLKKGTVVKTPFGRKGKVYDSGCARNTLDVYTNF